MERNKKSTTMSGKKESTLPTPAKMPSMMSECTTGLTPQAARPESASVVSAATASSIRPCSHAPITPNVSQKTRPMMTRNEGNAVKRPVRIRSMASDLGARGSRAA